MRDELLSVIRQVRRRWRLKVALRGAVVLAGLSLAVFLVFARALEAARFTPQAILTFRIVFAAAVAGLAAYLLVRPLLRRVSDAQVAMYLEEHEPTLQASIISALEAADDPAAPHSRGLVRRLIEEAIEKARAIEYGKRIEGTPVRKYAATIAAVTVAALALFAFGPAYLRHAGSALFMFSKDVEAAVPYRIEVKPGNATVARGADLVVTAELAGFEAADATLMVRKQAQDAQYERFPMIRGESGAYDGMLFDLGSPVEYFVEAAGVRSPTFTLKVVELPYVEKLELEYHFPAYTGLPPQKIEEGGDIAVLRGTEIRVRAVPTMATSGGHVVLEKDRDVALAPAADGALTGSFRVDRDGFYHLDMNAPDGERVTASPQYAIDVLTDQPPVVSISKPGRDTTASPIEELFVEARADDDYGVRHLELVYSLNGGAEQAVRLFEGQNRLPEVTAGHTFYLEELPLKPGDSISYYARAKDNDAVSGAKPATSDIYFVRIRPLSKDFKQAQSQAQGGGGGGGQQRQDGGLSEQQRRIIAATFNVQRDRKTLTAATLRENTTVVALSQKKLREQVEELLTQMARRLGGDDSFKNIMSLLAQSVPEMKTAEAKLQEAAPDAALPPEQKALQLLQQAEEEYETIVSIQQQQGGGGGGGGQQENRDLSELFELEIDRSANQYETRQQAAQQQADQQVDEIAQKLKELARRQEQEAERQRRRAAAGQAASGGGQGSSQRELAEQVEEAARRLEQLSREENRADLRQSAQQLRQAADAMRRAAANGQQASGAQSAEALERLRQAERQLQRSQSGRPERDTADALRRAEELVQEQQEVAGQVQGLGSPAERSREQVQQVLERKADMERRVGELEKDIDRAAAEMRRDERDASRKMSEAAASLRDNRVRDKIRYSGAMVRNGMSGSDTGNFEREIGLNLESLRNRLQEAQAAVGRSRPDQQAEALERARQLARSMQSLTERSRERAGREQEGAERDQEGAGRDREGAGRDREGARGNQEGAGRGREGAGRDQEGAQGGRGGRNEGERTQDGRGGEGDTTGAPSSAGGYGDRRPGGRMTPQDARQFRSELRQLTNDARALRGTLQGNRADQQALDDILKRLRALDNDKVFEDPAAFDRLQAQAAEAVKRFEFNLRRRAELKGNEVLLSGDGEVPEEFRKLVEQYYKSLSKTPDKKKP